MSQLDRTSADAAIAIRTSSRGPSAIAARSPSSRASSSHDLGSRRLGTGPDPEPASGSTRTPRLTMLFIAHDSGSRASERPAIMYRADRRTTPRSRFTETHDIPTGRFFRSPVPDPRQAERMATDDYEREAPSPVERRGRLPSTLPARRGRSRRVTPRSRRVAGHAVASPRVPGRGCRSAGREGPCEADDQRRVAFGCLGLDAEVTGSCVAVPTHRGQVEGRASDILRRSAGDRACHRPAEKLIVLGESGVR